MVVLASLQLWYGGSGMDKFPDHEHQMLLYPYGQVDPSTSLLKDS